MTLTPGRYWGLLTAIIVIACVRVAATHRVFSEVLDEPVHLAAGMEWLDHGRYTVELEHPPLARVAAAIGPYLHGLRHVPADHPITSGNEVLYANGRYRENLARARLGILPFLIVAAVIVAMWSRSLWGDAPSLAAALLFTNEPTVLSHSGLTTTDMAAATTTVAAAFALQRWIEINHDAVASRPSRYLAAAFLGIAAGAALLAKFSAILYLPAVFVPILLMAVLAHRSVFFKTLWKTGIVAAVVAVLTVWAGYRFAFAPLTSAGNAASVREVMSFHPRFEPAVISFAENVPIPAPEFFEGIGAVFRHNRYGHRSYLLGEWSETGWWYYFLIAIGVKTTLSLLALAILGLVHVGRGSRARDGSASIIPLLCGLAILLVSLTASINIGVRHVLPIYPFQAIAAGGGIAFLMTRRRKGPLLAAVLVFAAVVPSLAAHPDYLPYFNFLAGPEPAEILLDSNLDWGQDILRLEAAVKRRKIESLGVACTGNVDWARHDFPHLVEIKLEHYTPGWLAVSEMKRRELAPGAWLERFRPIERVGKSILLYSIPATTPN